MLILLSKNAIENISIGATQTLAWISDVPHILPKE